MQTRASKRYALRPEPGEEALKELTSYSPLAQRMLAARGISEAPAAEAFLNPDYERDLHDPFLLPDMDRAVARILAAIAGGERIVVWSDYDCDGIPGGAVLHDCFKAIGYENIRVYIPHRHEEGYGLNLKALEELAEEGTKVIVTVDCGITDHEPVDRANELGMEVIVTDHHLPHEKLPNAYAIVNPKRKDSVYPFDGLCGGGVAFKLAQAILKAGEFKLSPGREKWWLDMAGLSTLSDMVPLLGENRAIARYGLLVMRKSRRPGLQQLFKKLRINQRTLTEDDVGFMLAPRVNAASRMDAPEDAFRLLTTTDEAEGGALAARLDGLNNTRKGVVASMVKDMKRRASESFTSRSVITMGNPEWRPGLLGLAANTLVETFGKPVFLWGREGGTYLKGSCRSDGSVNVVDLMREVNHLFIDYGGHRFSGGFSAFQEHIHTFDQDIERAYERVRLEVTKPDEVLLEAELSLGEVTDKLYRSLEQFAPFGEGNPKPLFLFRNVRVVEAAPFGKEKTHTRYRLADATGSASAISFFTPEHIKGSVREGEHVSLVGAVERSTFAGRSELRIRLVDFAQA